jgi:hypothetical protein
VLELCIDNGNRELLEILPGQVTHLILRNNGGRANLSINRELSNTARLQSVIHLEVDWGREVPQFGLLGPLPALGSLSAEFCTPGSSMTDLARILSDRSNVAGLLSLSIKACFSPTYGPVQPIQPVQIYQVRACCEARGIAFAFEHSDSVPLAVRVSFSLIINSSRRSQARWI